MNPSSPNLVAPGVRSFMDFTLKNCRQLKDNYTTWAVNFGLATGLFVILGLFLYYKYKGKPTREEQERKKIEGQEYVMRKLGMHAATRQMAQQRQQLDGGSSLTGLPMWDQSLLIPGIQQS